MKDDNNNNCINDIEINNFIETHWKDIHHSRSQDWQYWLIILGIIAGIAALYKEGGKQAIVLIYVLVGFGGFISIWASFISYSHWVLHIKKMCYIDYLESFIYKKPLLNYHSFINTVEGNICNNKKFRDDFIVGGLIFAVHSTISILFIITTIVIILKDKIKFIIENNKLKIEFIPILSLIVSIVILLVIHFWVKKCLKNKRDKYYQTIIKKMNSNMDESYFKLPCD